MKKNRFFAFILSIIFFRKKKNKEEPVIPIEFGLTAGTEVVFKKIQDFRLTETSLNAVGQELAGTLAAPVEYGRSISLAELPDFTLTGPVTKVEKKQDEIYLETPTSRYVLSFGSKKIA